MKHQKVKLLCDPGLFAMGMILCSISTISCAFMIIVESKKPSPDTIVQLILVFFILLMDVSGMFAMPRWWVMITLDEKSIRYQAAFHKAKESPYSQYSHVYKGWYFHGRAQIGYKVYFIVISKTWLTTDELQQINQIGVSEDVIKIKYNKKNYRTLQAILPPKLRSQLERSFAEFN